jgi:hypothetical protein
VATTSLMLIPTPPAPPRPYGLFDVAMGPMSFPVPAAEGNGVEYVPDTCEDDVFLYQMNCPPVSGSKTFSGNESPVTGAPFGVITSYTCGLLGYTLEEVEQKVRTRMALREQRAVERRLWQGLAQGSALGLGGIPGLFQSATTLSAASCPTDAVAALEQALADNGVVGGIIHARPYMSAHLATNHLIERYNNRQVITSRGTPVCFGEGYGGTGPAGQAVTATTEYMYASGRVMIWASDVQVPDLRQTIDRSLNQVYALAERIYAVSVECGSWAIQVTRDCTTD